MDVHTVAPTADRERAAIEARLAALVPPDGTAPRQLTAAVRYALLAPGKRLRPLLTVWSATHFGATAAEALDPACAVEMVHAASLILDDLPSMDDATLRRGRLTTHLRFGEDTAILASVALLNQAFAVITRAAGLSPGRRAELVGVLSGAVGFDGLVAGQARDLRGVDDQDEMAALHDLYHQKTGALFVAAVEMGARIAGAPPEAVASARGFGHQLGLAFQIRDDLFDASDAAVTGKDADQDLGKRTIAAVLGGPGARARVAHHVDAALRHLDDVDGASPLGQLALALLPDASRLAHSA